MERWGGAPSMQIPTRPTKAVRDFWEELNDKALQNSVNTMHVDKKARIFQKEKLFNSNSEFLK